MTRLTFLTQTSSSLRDYLHQTTDCRLQQRKTRRLRITTPIVVFYAPLFEKREIPWLVLSVLFAKIGGFRPVFELPLGSSKTGPPSLFFLRPPTIKRSLPSFSFSLTPTFEGWTPRFASPQSKAHRAVDLNQTSGIPDFRGLAFLVSSSLSPTFADWAPRFATAQSKER